MNNPALADGQRMFADDFEEGAAPDHRGAHALAVDHADPAVTPVDEVLHPGPIRSLGGAN
ncbi:hypothetical protein ACFYO0_24280 [Streptomyces sp. NPDC006365]|uniref:hypothetical protein n=1 Tax=Streptomyces sp. NPDC006365 TaxID=3364744 RepID=UPI0036D17D08